MTSKKVNCYGNLTTCKDEKEAKVRNSYPVLRSAEQAPASARLLNNRNVRHRRALAGACSTEQASGFTQKPNNLERTLGKASENQFRY